MDLGFTIRHLQDKLNEFRLDLHRLRLYRSESWNYNVEHRVKEYEQAIAILTKANGVEQSESTCNLQNVSVSLPSLDDATKVAVRISEEAITPPLNAKEQAMFIAGFQECIKWLNVIFSNDR